MSYKAVFEFILLIHDFQNIDLPNQGLVRVTASIYQQLKHNQRVKHMLLNRIMPFHTVSHYNVKVNYRKRKYVNNQQLMIICSILK